jgi:hypothetical protein
LRAKTAQRILDFRAIHRLLKRILTHSEAISEQVIQKCVIFLLFTGEMAVAHAKSSLEADSDMRQRNSLFK